MPQGLNLEENYQFRGRWWLPSAPRTQVDGILELKSRDGIYLTLQGSLLPNTPLPEPMDLGIILGVTESGQAVTLCGCMQITWRFDFFGGSESYLATIAYLGRHFNYEEQIRFTSLYIWLYNLDEWMFQSGFTLPRKLDYKDLTIHYAKPDMIELFRSATVELSIGFSVTGPTYKFVQKSVEISQKTYLRITRLKGKKLEHYLEAATAFQSFVSLGVRGPVYPLRIRGLYQGDQRNPVDVYFPLILRPARRPKLPPEMVFPYPEIKGSIAAMLRRWFLKWNRLRPICGMYFSILYGRELYMENKFLAMAQVLESFHRRFVGGYYQTKEEFERELYPKLVGAIPEGIDHEYRDSLKAKMKFMYEYSLRKRFQDLIDRSPKKVVRELLGEAGDVDRFIKYVVDTRNYLTHYSKELEQRAVRGRRMYWVYNQMRILCETMLFREMGLGVRRIESLMLAHNEYLQEFELGRRGTGAG